MTTKDKISFAICVVLHIFVLVNLYNADQRTPRIVVIDQPAAKCPQLKPRTMNTQPRSYQL